MTGKRWGARDRGRMDAPQGHQCRQAERRRRYEHRHVRNAVADQPEHPRAERAAYGGEPHIVAQPLAEPVVPGEAERDGRNRQRQHDAPDTLHRFGNRHSDRAGHRPDQDQCGYGDDDAGSSEAALGHRRVADGASRHLRQQGCDATDAQVPRQSSPGPTPPPPGEPGRMDQSQSACLRRTD